jgi:hypothetical protein
VDTGDKAEAAHQQDRAVVATLAAQEELAEPRLAAVAVAQEGTQEVG